MLFKNVRASLARLISPSGLTTVNLPDAGITPALRIVAQAAAAAPVAAAAPKFRRAPVGPNGLTAYQEKLQYEARLKTEFGFHEKLEAAGMKTEARRKVLADFDRFVAARPLGKAAPPPATDEDGTAVPVETPDDTVEKIVEKLETLLAELKKIAGDTGDSEDEVEARAAIRRGDRAAARRSLESAITAITAKIESKTARAALRAEPSSRQRAYKLTASGFNEDPVVASLNASLNRGGSLSLAARAGMSLAPVGGTRTPATPAAVAPVALSSGYRDRVHAINAEIKSLDAKMHKSGIYDNKMIARQAELKAERNRLMAANSPHRRQ